MDFADFIDEKYETIPDDIRNKINEALSLAESNNDSLMFDIYDLID